MPLLEAFCFTDRNPQSDSHIKRAVNTLYNNLAFLWVAQLSLLLQWTLSADGYCKCPVKLCSGHLDQHFFPFWALATLLSKMFMTGPRTSKIYQFMVNLWRISSMINTALW